MNADAIAGLVIGLPHGWFLRPVFTFVFLVPAKNFLVRISRDPSFILFAGAVLAAMGAGCYMVLVVLLKNFVTVWSNFKMGWFFGFMLGALVYALLVHARKHEEL